jgi:hypothetical protein
MLSDNYNCYLHVHRMAIYKFTVFSVLYLYTSIYLSSDLHVLYSVHLRMAHVGRNM